MGEATDAMLGGAWRGELTSSAPPPEEQVELHGLGKWELNFSGFALSTPPDCKSSSTYSYSSNTPLTIIIRIRLIASEGTRTTHLRNEPR